MNSTSESEKRIAAEAGAESVADGMIVGLGTGSTVAYLLPALAARGVDIRCVATSIATEGQARELGIVIQPFDQLERLDIAIDGADQIAPDGWLVKGAGGAHTREKIVAAAAERFVVIADSSKMVEQITAPIPVELLSFGLAATIRALGSVAIREGAAPSPDGGVIADFSGEVGDPIITAALLAATPGVVDHGLFAPALVSEVLVGRGGGVERIEVRAGS